MDQNLRARLSRDCYPTYNVVNTLSSLQVYLMSSTCDQRLLFEFLFLKYFGIVMCAFLDNKSIPATKNVVEFDRWSLTAVVVPRCYPTQQRTPCLWKHLTTNARDGDYRNAQYIARTSTSTTDVLSIDTSVEQILFFADLYIPSDMPRPYY